MFIFFYVLNVVRPIADNVLIDMSYNNILSSEFLDIFIGDAAGQTRHKYWIRWTWTNCMTDRVERSHNAAREHVRQSESDM